jgi:hypothetical protein
LRTILQARSIGQIACGALESLKPGFVGEIADSFSNSFYIRTTNDDLVFLTRGDLKSPITVNLDSIVDFEHSLEPLGPVFYDQAKLRVGDGLAINLSGASTQPSQPDLSTLQIGQLRDALYIATTILGIVDTDESVLDNGSIAYHGAERFVLTGILSLRDSGDSEPFRKTVKQIVGLGGGFTPSGDDLLAGFLVTYNSLSRVVSRPKILIDFEFLKKSTSWISAKLLDYMQRGAFDDQVAHFIQSIGSANEDEFIIALESLLPRGHTSGVDIAVGSVLAVALLLDLANNGHETETIIHRLGLSS